MQLERQDLWSLEQYAERRKNFRTQVISHKKNRQLALGEHLRLYFEDTLTIQYQIQEMLRIEKIFEPAAIDEELEAYNPLIPDGSNLKATFMIEFDNPEERKQHLAKMIGIEEDIWLQVAGHDKVFPVADEDLERDNEEKTSAVHFLRFEFAAEMITALQQGADLWAGVDHQEYHVAEFTVSAAIRKALVEDFTLN